MTGSYLILSRRPRSSHGEGGTNPALQLLTLSVWACPTLLSLTPHKEFRFLLPVLPLSTTVTSHGVEAFTTWLSNRRQPPSPQPSLPTRLTGLALLATHLPLALYLSLFHQRGPIDALAFLSKALVAMGPGPPVTIHFLMPCHATPWTSHLHIPTRPLTLLHLDCSPEGRLSAEGSESDRFLTDPLGFSRGLYEGLGERQSPVPMPDFIVAFGSGWSALQPYLPPRYVTAASFFYSSFKGDMDSPNQEDSIVVLKRRQGLL